MFRHRSPGIPVFFRQILVVSNIENVKSFFFCAYRYRIVSTSIPISVSYCINIHHNVGHRCLGNFASDTPARTRLSVTPGKLTATMVLVDRTTYRRCSGKSRYSSRYDKLDGWLVDSLRCPAVHSTPLPVKHPERCLTAGATYDVPGNILSWMIYSY